jgi:tRNA 2-thiouridine synthesizing protein B
MNKIEIFLVTKPPLDGRTKLCIRLMEYSEDAYLFLAGDGVYNLLDAASLRLFPKEKIVACKEDLEARGLQAGEQAIVPKDFYNLLIENLISEGNQIYTF